MLVNNMIKCKNLVIGYYHPIYQMINLGITKGEYVAILGENGIGKSTFIKTILGLVTKIDGEIEINASHLGYLPQSNTGIKDFPASVFEIVLSGFTAKKKNRIFFNSEEKELVIHELQRLNIESLRDKKFISLSGGQQQKVLLARALVASTDCLVLDEPTTGLDISAKKEFFSILKMLHQQGVTILMITHDIKPIACDISKVLSFEDTLFYGSVEEFNHE